MFKSKSDATRLTEIQQILFVESLSEFAHRIRIAILPFVLAFTIDGARNNFFIKQ